MKHTFTGMMIALTLALAMLIGAAALAENVEPELPAAEQTQPADTDSTALQDAFKAYREAKSSARREALEAELKGYVESGKMTQEQADLILKDYTDRQSLRDGACPNCGYQFQSGQGKGGRMSGGKGNRMNGSFGMNGGMGGQGGRGMMGRQPSADRNPGNAGGM